VCVICFFVYLLRIIHSFLVFISFQNDSLGKNEISQTESKHLEKYANFVFKLFKKRKQKNNNFKRFTFKRALL